MAEVVGDRGVDHDPAGDEEPAAEAELGFVLGKRAVDDRDGGGLCEIQEAGLPDVEHTEERGGGRSLDDGVPGPVSADRQRTRNRRKAIRSVSVVVDRRQGVGARLQADQIDLAVRIRRIDGRDQARDVPRRAVEDRRAARSRESQGNDECCHDDPHYMPTWLTACCSTASARHRSTLHWFESSANTTTVLTFSVLSRGLNERNS